MGPERASASADCTAVKITGSRAGNKTGETGTLLAAADSGLPVNASKIDCFNSGQIQSNSGRTVSTGIFEYRATFSVVEPRKMWRRPLRPWVVITSMSPFSLA